MSDIETQLYIGAAHETYLEHLLRHVPRNVFDLLDIRQLVNVLHDLCAFRKCPNDLNTGRVSE